MKNPLIAILFIYILSLIFLNKKRISISFFMIASILNLALIIRNWHILGYAPLANIHQVAIVLGVCFLPAYIIMVIRKKMHRLAPYFSIAAAVSIGLAMLLDKGYLAHLPPALRSVWFIPHVASYMVSYSLAIVAFMISFKYENLSYRLLRFAFPLMTLGLVSGAIWADSAWASYWNWGDPKETWSFITWSLYIIYFYCRKTPRLERYKGIVHIMAFLALLTTFLLVNLLPKLQSPLHSYL